MTDNDEYRRRNGSLEATMQKHGVDCLLLNRTSLVKYLTGAENVCSWLFAKQDGRRVALVLESDYMDYHRQTLVNDIRTYRTHDPLSLCKRVARELELTRHGLALERFHLKHVQYEMLQTAFGPRVLTGADAGGLVLESAMSKTPEQIAQMRDVCRVAASALEAIHESARIGMTEHDLSRLADAELHKRGASSLTYLASGLRSCLAHAPAGNNVIESGPLIVDLHVSLNGLHCDVARTFFIGNDSESVEMYGCLRTAVVDTIAELRTGMPLVDVRAAFRRHLKLKSHWATLTGPLLHGVGIVNAELPSFDYPHVSRGYPEELPASVVLAVSNIGVYSSRGRGVRYEDTALVGQEGSEILTAQC